MDLTGIEVISANTQILCYVIRGQVQPGATTFITPPDARQQVGFIVYPAGGTIARHTHRALERHVIGMSEVLVVRSGRCHLDIFTDAHELVATRELGLNDVVVLVNGGHGLRVDEDTVLLEIKQGPYLGENDKETF
jgi:hypothetical protein